MTGLFPRMVADIGGTNARFAMVARDGSLHSALSLPTRRYPSLLDAAQAYIGQMRVRPRSACIAVAGPVNDDEVRLTNHSWTFSARELTAALGIERLRLINDFEAIALALPALAGDELFQLGGGEPVEGRPKAVLGPGTGLGVAQLVPVRGGFEPIATEGGHASIGPRNESELAILATLLRNGRQISREALLSGPGLELIYWALCRNANAHYEGFSAAEIQAHAVDGSDTLCHETLALFCAFLGTAAGDQALCCGAQGGVYIAGGIVPRFTEFLARSRFREHFEDKGPMRDYNRRIPVYVILAAHPGMLGAARASLQ